MKAWSAADQKRQDQRLDAVVDLVKRKTAKNISTLAIFDLDGTLFDNRSRTIFILRELSELFDRELPQLVAAFDRFHELGIVEYSLTGTLRKLGVRSRREAALIEKEWAKRFFSDDYQKFDIPLPGAKAYVKRVHEAGATVIYLTGRDLGRMFVGTAEALRLYGFPVGIMGTMMVVKRQFEEADEAFKRDVAAYLRRLGEVTAIFENEPANSNILQKAFPEASSFFVLTQHRPDAPALAPGILRIRDFRSRPPRP
ncbi:MAG: HAD family hydrolase [Elusimicrobia bacterium]|nr:HAD family hydrolase [Elusimicrobiota bacterium]